MPAAGDQAGLGLGMPADWALDAKTAALVRVGALAAIGSPEVCLEWSATRALATGATEDEITGMLLASPRLSGSAGSLGPYPAWQPRSSMTSRPRWMSQMVTERLFAAYQYLGMRSANPNSDDRRVTADHAFTHSRWENGAHQ
jgi:hypothetical protein